MILVLWMWQRAAIRNFPLGAVAALGFTMGFSTNVYQSTRLTGAIFTLAVAIDIAVHAAPRVKRIALLFATAFIGALPQIVFLITQPARFAGRAKVLSVTADNPFSYARAVVTNFFLNLDPHYLFVPPFLRGLTVARFTPADALFFYAGLLVLPFLAVRNGSRGRGYLYFALIVTILPSAITTDSPSTMRTSPLSFLVPLFTAAGIAVIARLVKTSQRRRLYYAGVAVVLMLADFGVIYRYQRSLYFRELSFQEIGVRMGKALRRYDSQYDAIVVSPHVSQSYLYIASFLPITPERFHRLPRRLYSIGMDRYTQMGKYHFVTESMMTRSIDELRGRGRILFINPQVVPGLAVVDSVRFRDDALYFQTY